MHDLAFAKELYGVSDVGVINEAEEVIVGHSRLLLCCNTAKATFIKIVPNTLVKQSFFALLQNAPKLPPCYHTTSTTRIFYEK
jgi:hypothetical protein